MLRSITLSSVLALTVLGTAPALAGFEWVPPADEPAPASMPSGPSAQDMLAAPGGQAWGMDGGAMQQQAGMSADPYAQQDQMMMQAMAAPMPQPSYPPPQAGYYAGASAYPNPVPPAPVPTGATGGLTINPYPMVQAGYAPSMMNTGSVEGAMMAESRQMNPLQLGNGYNTGGKPRPMMPTMPAAMPQQQQMMVGQPQPLTPGMHGSMPGMSMSAMPGGPLMPLPGYAPTQQPAQVAYAPYAPPPVMQAPIAPPPAPVAAAPLAPPPQAAKPVMQAPPADSAYPTGAPTSALKHSAAATTMAAPAGQYEDAVGFGKDLPLALALSQVIPGDYALFFETAIDAETNVSWQGGKPWNQVLQDMLAPLGLRAVIQPNLVMIRGA